MISRRNLLLGAAVTVPTGGFLLANACGSPASPAAAPISSGGGASQHHLQGRVLASVRDVRSVVNAAPTVEGAGVHLRRALGGRALPMLDPFLLLDTWKSDDPNDYAAGFPSHPHRGFETVTYMIDGAMEHRDNKGNQGRLGPLSAQWMTAGHGIVHSEMPKQERGLMWGFQLWVNLPRRAKLIKPRYQDIAAARIPDVAVERAKVRVVAGSAFGATGPVSGIEVAPTFLDLTLERGADVMHPVPGGHTAFIFVTDGAVRVGDSGKEVREGQLAVLTDGESFRARCDATSTRFVLIAGRPVNEPVARGGPFVMNTDDEIRQAWEDYRSGALTEDT
jgi:hypothetical protein